MPSGVDGSRNLTLRKELRWRASTQARACVLTWLSGRVSACGLGRMEKIGRAMPRVNCVNGLRTDFGFRRIEHVNALTG